MKRHLLAVALAACVLTGCATTPQTKAADQKAEANLVAQVDAGVLRCASADECSKLFDAAQQWAATRPHRVGFKVKNEQMVVSYMDGNRDMIVTLTLSAGLLKVDPGCFDYSLVFVPMSCGMQSLQVALQAETEIRQSL